MDKRLAKAFGDAVQGQVNDDRNHGWGVEDSKAVIEAVIAEDATIEIAALVAAKKEPTGYVPSEAAMAMVKRVINPSQFRQKLEAMKRPDGKTVLAESAGKRAKKEVFSIYGAE